MRPKKWEEWITNDWPHFCVEFGRLKGMVYLLAALNLGILGAILTKL